jgi:hypothetical protein
MSRRSLLLIAVFGLCACNPRKPLPVSKDLGPSVQVIDVAAKQPASPTVQLAQLPETEPNDDREHAQRLDPQKVLRGSLLAPTSQGAGRGDDDYFVWPAQPTAQTLRIDASGAPDLSLELFSESGESLGSIDERKLGEGERLWGLTLRPGQPLYVRVKGRVKPEAAHEPTLGAYQLSVSSVAATPDSEFEPNDSLAQATPMVGSDASGTLSTRRDEDFFVLQLPTAPGRKAVPDGEGLRQPAILRFTLSTPSVQPAVRIFFEPASAGSDGGAQQPKLALDVQASKGKEELQLRNVTIPAGSGRLFIAVRGQGFAKPPGEARYHLRALVEAPLEDAETEPNDVCATQANALTLSSGTAEIAGFLWPQDVDCYRIGATDGATLTYQAKLQLPGGDCTANLEIVRSETKPGDGKAKSKDDGRGKKDEAAKGSDGKLTEQTVTTSGEVLLKVSSRDRRTCFDAPYRLSVSTSDGDKQ